MNSSEIEVMKLNASTDKEALKYMGDYLVNLQLVTTNFPEKVIEREGKLPTGLPVKPFGVAIPHTCPEYVFQSKLLIGALKHPVVFRQMGDSHEQVDVSFVFMPAILESGRHLTLLEKLFNSLQDDQFIDALTNWDGKKSTLTRLVRSGVK
ncbi:PTS sugar transporter subunit IIA [Virgibacillus siamensis]|uniref:PTS sugar transporter subunit IIA n=2 Tax=Virgibacillus siamensis TaxID=480071 RepID=A0ABN1GH46_9BACI